jgi:hypothetical protein
MCLLEDVTRRKRMRGMWKRMRMVCEIEMELASINYPLL